MIEPPASDPEKTAPGIGLGDAVVYLDALGITVELQPREGRWRYVVRGHTMTVDEVIALAALVVPQKPGQDRA